MSKEISLDVRTVEDCDEVRVGDSVYVKAIVVGVYNDFAVLTYYGQSNPTVDADAVIVKQLAVVNHEDYVVEPAVTV